MLSLEGAYHTMNPKRPEVRKRSYIQRRFRPATDPTDQSVMGLVVLRLLTKSHKVLNQKDEIPMTLGQGFVFPDVVQHAFVAQLGRLGDALYAMVFQDEIVSSACQHAQYSAFRRGRNDADTFQIICLPYSNRTQNILSSSSFCVRSHPSQCSPI